MAPTPEKLSSSPAPTPTTKPSDTLVKNFCATLDTRWQEFDAATMQEAQSRA